MILLLLPSYYVIQWLSNDINSFRWVVFVSILLGFISFYSYPEKVYKPVGIISAILCSILLIFYMGLCPNWIFNWISCIFGWAVSCFIFLMSAFIGQEISIIFKRICVGIALIAPSTGLIFYFISGNYNYYNLGIMTSLTSSLFNTFWNTTSQSIGLPSLIDIDTLSSSTATSTATFKKE